MLDCIRALYVVDVGVDNPGGADWEACETVANSSIASNAELRFLDTECPSAAVEGLSFTLLFLVLVLRADSATGAKENSPSGMEASDTTGGREGEYGSSIDLECLLLFIAEGGQCERVADSARLCANA